jgi:glucokinase
MSAKLSQGEHVIGVDIGGTKMLAAVLDHRFKVVARCKKKSRSKKADETSEDRLLQAVREALETSKVKSVRGIGVGSPGPLDPQTGVIIDTPNLAWKNFPLAETLEKEFGVPVVVDNDVNVGTYGEWCFGEIKNCKHVVGIFPGTGIGGGIIIDGKLLHGFSGAAGEIGHMTVEVDGPFCGCGKRGCLEALASRIAIAKEAAALAARDDAPHLFAQCGVSLAKIRSGDLADSIAAGDRMVESVVRKAAYYTGVAAGNLVNVLSPEAVVLGGGLVEAMEKLYIEEVKRGIKDHAMPFLREGLRVTSAKLGDDAVIMGAARLICDHLAASG